MAIARGVHERSARHARRRRGERSVRRDRFEAMWVAARVRRVEVVPDGDPVETEGFYTRPEVAQVGDRRVLQTTVHTETNVHRTTPISVAARRMRSAPGARCRRACGTANTRFPPRPFRTP